MTEEERAQRAEDLKRQVLALCPPANVGMVDARLTIEEFQELRGLLNDLREIGFEPFLIPDRKLEWIIDNPKQWDHDKTWLEGFGFDQLKEILRLSRIYGAEFLPFENALRLGKTLFMLCLTRARTLTCITLKQSSVLRRKGMGGRLRHPMGFPTVTTKLLGCLLQCQLSRDRSILIDVI